MIYQIGAAERSRHLSVRRDQVLRREKEGGRWEMGNVILIFTKPNSGIRALLSFNVKNKSYEQLPIQL